MSKVFVFTDFGGPEHQALIERPVPEPGPGELAVHVRAAGVNPFDVKVRSGALGRTRTLPAPMGQEVAGVVTRVGEGVEGFTVGDAVLGPTAPGWGAIAEDTLVRAAQAVPKPAEISFADAATIPVAGATAYDLTHQVELEAGQTLLVVGAGGGVGLMAAQIGNVHKFTVIGIASEAKRELVESTGATFVATGDGVADRVRAVAPEGVDLIVDLVGGQTLRAVAEVVRDRSHIISAPDPDTAAELGGSALVRTPESMEKITGVIQYGLVDPHVTGRYPLERAAAAIAAVERGHATGKTVIEIAE
ncbi:MAG: NADP-dependent oxidoreductase [Georgenia sp.]